MLLDHRQHRQRAHIDLSVLQTLVFINQRSVVGTVGRPGTTGTRRAGASFHLSLFGGKRISQADSVLSCGGASRHQRAGQVVSAHAQRLRLPVLPGQELDLDLGVPVASPPLPGRVLQPRPLQAGGVCVLVIRGVNIPESTLARLLFSTGNF